MRRRRRPPLRLALIGLCLLFTVSAVQAFAGSTSVPTTYKLSSSQAITADTLKPASCSGITLTATVTGSGTINGGAASELILGSSGVDTIRGNNGSDCIVAGGGDDSLRGDAGTDVCIGGPGTDSFHASCETQIQ